MSATTPGVFRHDGDGVGTVVDAYAARCRLLMRAYPRSWRQAREQEVLAVLLDMRDNEQTALSSHHDGDPVGSPAPHRPRQRGHRDLRRPSWAVHLDLLSGGLQTRWDQAWSFLPTRVRDRIAVLSTVLGAAVCTVTLLFGEVSWPWIASNTVTAPGYSYSPPLLQTAGAAVYGLWLLALLAAVVLGRAQLARWMLAATAAGAVLLAVVRVIPHPPLYVLGPIALAATLATVGHLPTKRTTRGWLMLAYLLLTGGLSLILAANTTTAGFDPVWRFYRYEGVALLSATVVVLAGVAVLLAAGASLAGRAWFLATAITALPYVYLCILAVNGRNREQMLVIAAMASAVPLLLVLGAVLGRRFAGGQPSDRGNEPTGRSSTVTARPGDPAV